MAGIESALLKSALSRIFTLGITRLHATLKHNHAVRDALTADVSKKDAALERASREIRRALGNDGKLTEKMARFLEELSQSGLLEQLALSAIAQTPSTSTLTAFSILFRNHFGEGIGNYESPLTLYERIQQMVVASLVYGDLSVSTFYLAKAILRELKDISADREQVLRHQFPKYDDSNRGANSLREVASEAPWLVESPSALRAFTQELAKALEPLYSEIRVEGPFERSEDIPFDDIYVESKLLPIEYSVAKGIQPAPSDTRPLSPTEFLSELTRAVVLGDPGGGKTTLVRNLCKQLLTQYPKGDAPLPIFVTLRKFYAARNRDTSLSLLDYLLSELAQQANLFSVEELRRPILNLLAFGRALIVFDGLDEILQVGKRREFATAVSQFCSQFSLCRFVVTSRKVGYSRAALSSFPAFELAPLDFETINRYVRLSALNIFKKNEGEAFQAVRQFESESGRNARDFVQNPLLLSLIVWLFHSTNRIPDNRAQIYEQCSEILFKRWDSLRELWPDVPAPHRLFNLLSHLAAKMYLDVGVQDGASRAWLIKVITEYFKSDFLEAAETRAHEAAEKFADHLAGRAWVLREVGPGVYEFTHRTFLEYFFALHLNDQSLSLEELFDKLVPHIARAEWNVPAHLSIQIWVHGKRQHSQYAVDRLIKLYEESTGQQRAAVVEFIAQATEYLQPSEGSLEKIARIVTMDIRNDHTWKKAFISVLQTSNEMRHSVYRGMGNGLAASVQNGRYSRLAFVFDWFKAFNVIDVAGEQHTLPARLDILREAASACAAEILAPLEQLEKENAAACKARFDLTGEFDPAVVSQFGLRLWQASSDGPLYRLDWRAVDFAIMVSEFCSVLSGQISLGDCRYAKLACELAKSDLFRLPIVVSQGSIVTGMPLSADISYLAHPKVITADIAAGACLAVCGYSELNKFYSAFEQQDSFLQAATALLNLANGQLRDREQAMFFRAWSTNSRSLFHGIHSPATTVSVRDLINSTI